MSHVIRRRSWELSFRPDPRCSLDMGSPATCDVCGRSFSLPDCGWTGVYGSFQIPADGLCIPCRQACSDAREQRAYLAQLRSV